jgi:radical SAM-linked protein
LEENRPASAGMKEAVPSVVRLWFARKGPAEYLAHLDMMRLFERSLRRAGIPLAYSQGYNPRPHLVFALPLGVGVQAEAEMVDIETAVPFCAEELAQRLASRLPEGVTVRGAKAVIPSGKSVMGRVVRAVYRLRAPGIVPAAMSLVAAGELPVEKSGKGTVRTLDIRPLILSVQTGEDEAVFRVKAGSSENLRPDLILDAMVLYGGLDRLAADNAEIVRERVELVDDGVA